VNGDREQGKVFKTKSCRRLPLGSKVDLEAGLEMYVPQLQSGKIIQKGLLPRNASLHAQPSHQTRAAEPAVLVFST
jgi:hypothetical protein